VIELVVEHAFLGIAFLDMGVGTVWNRGFKLHCTNGMAGSGAYYCSELF